MEVLQVNGLYVKCYKYAKLNIFNSYLTVLTVPTVLYDQRNTKWVWCFIGAADVGVRLILIHLSHIHWTGSGEEASNQMVTGLLGESHYQSYWSLKIGWSRNGNLRLKQDGSKMVTRHLRYSKLRPTLKGYWTTTYDVGEYWRIGNCNVQNASLMV